MKVSIITPSFNSAKTIADTLKSVVSQTYSNIEHIIIDGGSNDGTIDIVRKYKNSASKVVSELDEGIFDAMNKGIRMAKGDIIGILNSDDFYISNSVIEKVVEKMQETGADCLWGDLVYVDKNDINKIVRRWKSSPYKKGKFQRGWMPPHPAFFARKWVYEKYGVFNLGLAKVSADYEIMLRFLERYRIKSTYLPEVLVKMRTGGISNRNIKQIIIGNIECYQAWKINGLKISPFIIFLKPLSKAFQFFER